MEIPNQHLTKLIQQCKASIIWALQPFHCFRLFGSHGEDKHGSFLFSRAQKDNQYIECGVSHNQEHLRPLDEQARYWMNHTGALLSCLLASIDYTREAQEKIVKFYSTDIVPYLGASRDAPHFLRLWQSFMTDDGCPIELSWDWGRGCTSPKVRLSIEPLSLDAGTLTYPFNRKGQRKFLEQMIEHLPGADLSWFRHFSVAFAGEERFNQARFKAQRHLAHVFYAFDFEGQQCIPKAYFFPQADTQSSGGDRWASIRQVVATAPHSQHQETQAVSLLDAFFQDESRNIAVEMVAIDLVDPRSSHFKTYFRSRATDFESVGWFLTLGGRLSTATIDAGLERLKYLWNALFEVIDNTYLRFVDHRTSVVLHYVDFRLGQKIPQVKIYIPVRHYVASDWKLMEVLSKVLTLQGQKEYLGNYKQVLKENL